MKIKLVCVISLVWLVVLGMTSCSPNKKVDESYLVGLWVEDSKMCEDSTSCGSIEFTSDDSFVAENVPEMCFGYIRSFTDERMDGTGIWEITDQGDLLTFGEVNLKFDANIDSDTPILIGRYISIIE